ncbi:MAG: TolC family protein [Verrucomicrobiota bacterium]
MLTNATTPEKRNHNTVSLKTLAALSAIALCFSACSEAPINSSPPLATSDPSPTSTEISSAQTPAEIPYSPEASSTYPESGFSTNENSETIPESATSVPAPAIEPLPDPYVYGTPETESPNSSYRLPEIQPLDELPLRLEDALSRALKYNLDVQIKAYDRELASDVIRQARGAFNPEFKVDLEYEDIDRPQNTQEFVETGGNSTLLTGEPRIFEENNWRYNISLEGRLPTGTEYELFNQQEILSNTLSRTSALSLFTPEFQNFTGITLTQPLLRNFGTNVNLAEIRVARVDKKISELEVQEAMLNTVSETLLAYFDLIYAVAEMRLKQEELELASRLTLDKQEQLEKGQVSPRELTRTESALAEIIEELTQARNQVFEKQTVLQSLLADIRIDDANTIYTPSTNLPIQDRETDLSQLLAEAATHRPVLKIAKHAVERESIRLVYARNQTWPQLDVKATLGRNGLAPNLSRSYRKSIGDGQGNQWSVGFEFSFPLWNDTALGQRDEAENRKQQSILQLKQAEVNTSLIIQQLLSIIDSNYERLDAMSLFKSNAIRLKEQEEIRLEKGLSTELEVLKFRRDLHRAKVRELAARVDLKKAYVRLFEATGTLLTRYNIHFDSKVAGQQSSRSMLHH